MGRAIESRHEPSIMKTEGQQYIHYNKAGLMMYTLSDFIGPERFNNALKKFMDKYRYKSSPYADIGTFVKMIKDDTPDDALIIDCRKHVLCPGFIDLNANIGEPGLIYFLELHKHLISFHLF